MTLTVHTTSHEGLSALQLEGPDLRLVVLPELGAKVISLVYTPTGREFLWRHPGRPLRLAEYGAAYEAGDISGWDECFPTIGAGVYPEAPWAGVALPDHGELWALPWEYEQRGDQFRMWVHSVRFAYTFERTFTFRPSAALEIEYRVTNPTPYPLRALWSMHPFLRVSPQTRALLPEGARVRVEVTKGGRLGGFLAEHPWPQTTEVDGQAVNLSLQGPLDPRWMAKLFTTRLQEGWAALHDPADDHFLRFDFDPQQVAYVGLAQMRGGWPENETASYSLILEPCSGWPDRLDIAIPRGDCVTIPARGHRRWTVTLRVGPGTPLSH
jgi:galactose mutarotase-like enzyme